MAIVVKVEADTRAERFAEYFRKALDTSDAAIYAVHQRLQGHNELYIEVFAYLSWKERGMIKDAIGRARDE